MIGCRRDAIVSEKLKMNLTVGQYVFLCNDFNHVKCLQQKNVEILSAWWSKVTVQYNPVVAE
jgi:hypothetical protein